MTAVAETVVSDEQRQVTVRSWKTPIIFAVFTVLFALLPIAAPPLVRAIFGLPQTDGRRKSKKQNKKQTKSRSKKEVSA